MIDADSLRARVDAIGEGEGMGGVKGAQPNRDPTIAARKPPLGGAPTSAGLVAPLFQSTRLVAAVDELGSLRSRLSHQVMPFPTCLDQPPIDERFSKSASKIRDFDGTVLAPREPTPILGMTCG